MNVKASIERANVESIFPLGPAQRGMLYYSIANPDQPAFREQVRIRLSGELRVGLLRRAWETVVERHAALRSQFAWEHRENPLQVVRCSVELPWTEHDWSEAAEGDAESRMEELLARDRTAPLPLDRAPLLRLTVVRCAGERWEVVWTFHHTVIDGWSTALVQSEVWAAYAALVRGEEPELPPAPSLHAWIAWLGRRDEAAEREFWGRALEGYDQPFETGFPGGRVAAGEGDQGEVRRTLTASDVERLSAFTRAQGLTLNALLAGAWALLLRRYTGRPRVVFGSVTSGRPPELPGIERAVGMFTNALPAWLALPGEAPVGAWLSGLQVDLAELHDHAGRALEEIQEWAGLPVREAPFDTLFVFENYPTNAESLQDLPGVTITRVDMVERGAFSVSLYATPLGGRLRLWLDYRRGRLNDGAAERLMGHYLALVEGLARDPGRRLADVPMLPEEERARLLGTWAAGEPLPETAGERAVHELFAAAAGERPEAVAVVDGGRHVSYRELAARAGAVSRRLHAACGSVRPDDRIALVADRSVEAVVGMLGTLGAGTAYVPVEPTTPAGRLAYVLEDAGVRAVVTRRGLAADLPGPQRPVVVLEDADADGAPAAQGAAAPPESLAYVIYTSGSTGRPKGVLVTHRNLASYTATAADEQAVGPGVRVLQFASLGFDTSAEEIWPCLTRGGTLVLRDDRALGAPAELAEALHAWRPEVLDLPTAFWHELASTAATGELALPPAVRLVILGGERALGERVADWRRGLGERSGEVRLLNTYGPTETTVVALAAPVADGDLDGDPPIGRPVPGARAYVLDPDLGPLPEGLAGELAIGGAGVARGYLGRPALTAERFVPDPFARGERGARLYRSGDLAAFRSDGLLEFRGRIDTQVKVRGYRVEPGEIESVLASHPVLREAAVVARGEAGSGDVRLAAYVVAAGGREVPRATALRAFVAERLPEYMVPSSFTALVELPRTASGKLDRRALPEPAAAFDDRAAFSAPRTPVEEVLAGWWAELLGLDRISRDDDFFRLGGHSLLVGRLAARVRKELGVDLPMIEVFRHPVLGDLAAYVDAAEAGTESGLPALPPLVSVDRGRPLPLSYQQERVWFLNNLVPNTTAYNFQIRFWLEGELDAAALARALSEIVRRQEVLRTTFPEIDGVAMQVVHEPWRVELPLTDLSGLGRETAERCAEEILHREVGRPFDVTTLPLIRWRLLQIAEDAYQIIQVEHHFVHDGWSISLVLSELKALYRAFAAGEPSPLPELAFQYGDFAVWQRGWMRGETLERISSFWRRKLDGAPQVLDLPSDRPRPSRLTLRGDAIREFLPTELYRALRAFGRREGFTLYMTMMAAFEAVIHRYVGADDFLIGTGIANRRVAELEPIVGMMVNSLVVRSDLRGDPTFRELLERVRATTLEVYTHQDMPFERLVEELQPRRDPSRNPLFQVMFSFHDAAVPDLDFEDLRMGFLVEHNRTAKTDLNVIVAPRAEQRVGRVAHARDDLAMVTWEFSTDLFDKERIERLIRHYYTLVAAALAEPDRRVSDLPLLPEDEAAQVLHEWSGRRAPYPRDAGLAELFVRRAAERPEAEAIRYEGATTSYGELAERAHRLAHRLRERGVRRGDPVALLLDRSPEAIVALLAVVAAGGVYVPVDPSYPAERLAFLLDDSGASLVVTREEHRGPLAELPAGAGRSVLCLDDPAERRAVAACPAIAPAVPACGDDLANLIYTSGSTGRPKGVAVPQRAVARLVLGTDYTPFGPARTHVHLASVSFDASTYEIWGALLNGGRLVVLPPGPQAPDRLAETMARERPTAMFLTTGLFNQLVEDELGSLAPLCHLMTGGEAASPVHFHRVTEAHSDLVLSNVYGPTENTTFSTIHTPGAYLPDAPVPIGEPIPNSRCYVADRNGRAVPVGVAGELLVGGDGLAWGYWRRPGLSAERFVPEPFSGEPGTRLYRTGDLVRWNAAGAIEFLGRNDLQVKVRGFRVEPGEVELALASHPGVAEAAVVVRELAGEKALVAYVVPGEGAAPADALGRQLREHLRGRLPEHMVPQLFVPMERLPLTVNGKVDRRALPDPTVEVAAGGPVAPRTDLERALAALWAELLPVEEVGVTDDFFDLGGHSLIATRIAARIRRDLGFALPIAVLFEEPTVERLARALAAEGAVVAEAAPAPAALPGDESLSEEELDALLGRMLAKSEA